MEHLQKDTGHTIKVGKKPKNLFVKILQFIGILPKYWQFDLTNLTANNVYRISEQVKLMPYDICKADLEQSVTGLFMNHQDKLVRIVAIGLDNSKNGPSERLLTAIKNDFTLADIQKALQLVIIHASLTSFVNAIVLIHGSNILTITNEPIKMDLPPGISASDDDNND